MGRHSLRLLLSVVLFSLLFVGGSPVKSAASTPCDTGTTSLVNASFEAPAVSGALQFEEPDDVPGWSTTDSRIEIWTDESGIPAYDGRQFVELNYLVPGTLFQDVATVPGTTLVWSLAHRARTLSASVVTDEMRVLIGAVPPGGSAADQGLVQSGPVLASDSTAWTVHSGTYTVPDGQTTTRFAFQAVSSGSGLASAGNFLDAIVFSSQACVQAILSASPTRADVDDVVTYSVSLTHIGGSPTSRVSLDIPIPAGTTFVAGSASAGGVSGGTSVVFTNPTGAGGPGVLTAANDATNPVVVSFQVRVDDPLVGSQLTNTASVSAFPRTPETQDTNQVVTVLGPPEMSATAPQPRIGLDVRGNLGRPVEGIPVDLVGLDLPEGSVARLTLYQPENRLFDQPVARRTLNETLRLPGGLAPGVYSLVYTVTLPSGEVLALNRTFEVSAEGLLVSLGDNGVGLGPMVKPEPKKLAYTGLQSNSLPWWALVSLAFGMLLVLYSIRALRMVEQMAASLEPPREKTPWEILATPIRVPGIDYQPGTSTEQVTAQSLSEAIHDLDIALSILLARKIGRFSPSTTSLFR